MHSVTCVGPINTSTCPWLWPDQQACMMKLVSWTRRCPSKVCALPTLHFTNMLIQYQVCDMRNGDFIVGCASKTTIFVWDALSDNGGGAAFHQPESCTVDVYLLKDLWACHLDKLRLLGPEIWGFILMKLKGHRFNYRRFYMSRAFNCSLTNTGVLRKKWDVFDKDPYN